MQFHNDVAYGRSKACKERIIILYDNLSIATYPLRIIITIPFFKAFGINWLITLFPLDKDLHHQHWNSFWIDCRLQSTTPLSVKLLGLKSHWDLPTFIMLLLFELGKSIPIIIDIRFLTKKNRFSTKHFIINIEILPGPIYNSIISSIVRSERRISSFI